MNRTVAIGASTRKKSAFFAVWTEQSLVSAGVALQTKVRHGGVQQASGYRAVRGMAIGAVFGNIAMLIDKGAAFLHMATGAHIPHRNPLQQLAVSGTVGVMAVKTVHFLFAHRMV